MRDYRGSEVYSLSDPDISYVAEELMLNHKNTHEDWIPKIHAIDFGLLYCIIVQPTVQHNKVIIIGHEFLGEVHIPPTCVHPSETGKFHQSNIGKSVIVKVESYFMDALTEQKPTIKTNENKNNMINENMNVAETLTFNLDNLTSLRVSIDENNTPWFIAKDVATVLGYKNLSSAILKHVDQEDKVQIAFYDLQLMGFTDFGTKGGILVNESGLYSLILSSKLESAKKFKRWVTSEVLPSIRKHGAYFKDQEKKTNEELLVDGLLAAQSIIKEKEALLADNVVHINKQDNLIYRKSEPMALSKYLRNNNKVVQAANIWMEDNGYLSRRFNMKTGKPQGWIITEKGRELKCATQYRNDPTVYWTHEILEILPKFTKLVELTIKYGLSDMKNLKAIA